MATASCYSASHSSAEASFASRTCTSSYPSSWASPTWAGYTHDCFSTHGMASLRGANSSTSSPSQHSKSPTKSSTTPPCLDTSNASKVPPQVINSQHLSVFPSAAFLHTNRTQVLRSLRSLSALLSGATRVLDTKRRTRLSYCLKFTTLRLESLRLVRHLTAGDHCSWCRRANSTVRQRANSTDQPSVVMDSSFTQSRRLFAHAGGLTGSPPQEVSLPMLTKSDEQTEDGHAMMTFDTLHSFRT